MPSLQNRIENAALRVFYPLFVTLRHPRPPKGPMLDLSKFTLVFEDDFSDSSLSKWTPRLSGSGKASDIRKGGFWSPEQAFVQDGNLHIRTEWRDDGPCGAGYYAGCLDTSTTYLQTYGYFECRCILPAAKGMWSAFWLQSPRVGKGVPAAKGMEIDVFESPLYRRKGNNAIITSNLHYNGYGPEHIITAMDRSTGFRM